MASSRCKGPHKQLAPVLTPMLCAWQAPGHVHSCCSGLRHSGRKLRFLRSKVAKAGMACPCPEVLEEDVQRPPRAQSMQAALTHLPNLPVQVTFRCGPLDPSLPIITHDNPY